MRKIIKLYLTLSLICWSTVLSAMDERLIKANAYYSEGMFQDAIEVYEDILKTGMTSPELHYNLGNAYYRNGYLPAAILNFERALLLAPHDKDIRYNLDLAYSQITDKIETVEEFFLARWFAAVRGSTDSDHWAIVSIILFVLTFAALFVYFFSRSTAIRKITFFMALLFLIGSVTTLSFSYNQKQRLLKQNRAIVFAPSVTVRSSPDRSGTELFVLHEGTRVRILQTIGEWYEIELEDGNSGWMQANNLETI
ncbi:MAG: tetratricopeptide repeat protein [Marinilabiliaceae bacterium]|nr:tetratricopeptide repeat protein [Marinilabiliaceae bacterium]